MSAGRILVVDDDPQIRRVMRIMLTGQGYEVDDARTGEAALDVLTKHRFDLVLLDISMPGMGGLETCRAIRETSEISVIVLSVKDRDIDKIEALDAGADDYITKPFSAIELSARIRAALRRTPWTRGPSGRVEINGLIVDFATRQVTRDHESWRLTPKEYDLLRFMVANPNRTLTHRELMQAAWGPAQSGDLDALRAVIHQVRRKIEDDPANPTHLLTDSWVGYRFQIAESSKAWPQQSVQ
jgi:two-component system KDP operon response regulator KdpE